jgi:L-malate glycosyltransferase
MKQPMRILFLADADSPHTRKWALSLAGKGFEIGIFSIRKGMSGWHKEVRNITLFDENGLSNDVFSGGITGKLAYLKQLPAVKRAIRTFRPHIVHAHYATSYGLLGALSGFHPLIISSWGSDVMDFPSKGFIAKRVLRYNLNKADLLLATSPTIEKYIHRITHKKVEITPFGVDTELFRPALQPKQEGSPVVFGVVKSLEKIYRIDLVLEAFAEVRSRINSKLFIVGGGTQEEELKALAARLDINDDVTFTGKVDHSEVPNYHAKIDVLLNVSEYESFGVTVLEAMSTGKPVIVTDTGGLADLVEHNIDGLKIPVNDKKALVAAMETLGAASKLREAMGKKGREKVLRDYDWSRNLEKIISIYERFGNG